MGYPVIINYARNAEAAEETKKLVEEKGVAAELMPFDVADGAAAEAALETWQNGHPVLGEVQKRRRQHHRPLRTGLLLRLYGGGTCGYHHQIVSP